MAHLFLILILCIKCCLLYTSKSGLTKTFNDYARKYGLLKEKDKNLEGNDVREGLSAIISIKVPEHYLQFEGQTKSKLGTPEARNIVDSIVYEKLSYFLEENKEIADNLVKKMIKAAQVRLSLIHI